MSARPSATAVIAEDEPALAQALQRMLAQAWPELEVLHVAHDGDLALDAIRQLRPDVAFLDIRMPGRSGLELAAALDTGAGYTPAVVFVTAYDHYAVQAFEASAADYLLKPVSAERLERCVARIGARLAERDPARSSDELRRLVALLQRELPAAGAGPRQGWLRFLRTSVGEVVRQIPVDDILYLQAQDKYVSVVTRDATALVRVPLSELAAALDPARFAQIHRSTVVSLDAIDTIRRDFAGRTFVHLRPVAGMREVRLPVSRQYAGQFKAM